MNNDKDNQKIKTKDQLLATLHNTTMYGMVGGILSGVIEALWYMPFNMLGANIMRGGIGGVILGTLYGLVASWMGWKVDWRTGFVIGVIVLGWLLLRT